jgi:hypothetical protein
MAGGDDMNRTIGSIETFDGVSYRVVDDRILPDAKRMPFLYKMNLWAIGFLLIGSGLTVALFSTRSLIIQASPLEALWYVLAMIVFVPVHELLHGISFVLFSGRSWKTIRFGLILKNGLAYCISTVPVRIRRARLSLMMPLYVVAIPLYVVAYWTSDFGLALFTVFLSAGSVGDLYYLWTLRKVSPTYYMMEAMPSKEGYEIGYLLYEQV